MGTERRRKKKKRLNWPAVLALVLLVFNGILALVALLNMYSALARVRLTAEVQYTGFLDLYMFRIAFRGGFAGTGWGEDPEKPSPDDPAGGRDRLGEGRCRF